MIVVNFKSVIQLRVGKLNDIKLVSECNKILGNYRPWPAEAKAACFQPEDLIRFTKNTTKMNIRHLLYCVRVV